MLRSFDYAAWTALNRYRSMSVVGGVEARVEAWRQRVHADFIESYEQHIAGASSYPKDPAFAHVLTELFLLQKAVYEIGYELSNRPDWIKIPLTGIRDLLART